MYDYSSSGGVLENSLLKLKKDDNIPLSYSTIATK